MKPKDYCPIAKIDLTHADIGGCLTCNAIHKAMVDERERCAKIAETFTGDCNDSEYGGPCPCPEEYAALIRKDE